MNERSRLRKEQKATKKQDFNKLHFTIGQIVRILSSKALSILSL